LYGSYSRSLTLREGYRFWVFENGALREMLGPESERERERERKKQQEAGE
jgi:hypothetical protein